MVRTEMTQIFLLISLCTCFAFGVDSPDCDERLTGPQGTFHSPHFPANYSNNQQCVYSIAVPPGQRLTLTFHSFHLEGLDPNHHCLDWVEVHDGGSRLAPMLNWYFCGRGYVGPHTDLRSTGNQLYIVFHSNANHTYPGFNASYVTDTKGDNFALVADSTFHNVYRVDLFTESFVNVSLPYLHHPAVISYDAYTRPIRLFWIEENGSDIFSADIDGSDKQVVVDLGKNAKLQDVALDASSNLIFFSDGGNDVIGVASVATGSYRHVITNAFSGMKLIAVDTRARLVFWTDGPMVQRSSFSGENRQTVVTVPLDVQILSITVNTEAGTLLWLTKSSDGRLSIESADLEGRGRKLVYDTHTDVYNLTRIVFYNNTLYLVRVDIDSDGTSSQLLWLSSNEPEFLWKAHNYRVTDVAFYNQSTNKQEPTICRQDNGGCSDICIPLPGNETQCLCPKGQVLGEDRLTCRVLSFETDSKTPVIIGGVVAAVFVTVGVVIAVVFCRRRRMAVAGSRQSSAERVADRSRPQPLNTTSSSPPFTESSHPVNLTSSEAGDSSLDGSWQGLSIVANSSARSSSSSEHCYATIEEEGDTIPKRPYLQAPPPLHQREHGDFSGESESNSVFFDALSHQSTQPETTTTQ